MARRNDALAPECSPDGSGYHLGWVSSYLAAHGFFRIATSIYASLSQGTELLYLFAFAFGRHSAAALVHFAFLCALPLLMLLYSRRFGFPVAGVLASALVFLSPVVGWDGSTAYIDVAVTCVLFALFYLLEVWNQERLPALLIPIGLLAGFSYAMKYTAFVALPFTLGYVGWALLRRREKLWRPLAVVLLCALVMILPWVIKNWIWVGNPFAPFFNRVFPNPYVHIGFEDQFRKQMAEWGNLATKWAIPLEVTIRGQRLQGLLGPVFLLFPLSLLALRHAAGRRLLLAAFVFLLPYPGNLGTRFLIPCLPFVSLALGLAVMNWKAAVPSLVLLHALTCWPFVLDKYCDPYSLHISTLPWRAALRLEPERKFLNECSGGAYEMDLAIEKLVPPEARILAFSGPPQAYHTRNVVGFYEAAFNENASRLVYLPLLPGWWPTRRLTFTFPEQDVRAVRVVQTVSDPVAQWRIDEMRVFRGDEEQMREPQWRLQAYPNPWEVQFAFDNNPITPWQSWQPLFAGMYVGVDFGAPTRVSRVVLDSPPEDAKATLVLEGRPEGGAWRRLAGAPAVSQIPPPAQLRRLISRELKWQGIEYLMVSGSDFGAATILQAPNEWGLKLIAAHGGINLYRIE